MEEQSELKIQVEGVFHNCPFEGEIYKIEQNFDKQGNELPTVDLFIRLHKSIETFTGVRSGLYIQSWAEGQVKSWGSLSRI